MYGFGVNSLLRTGSVYVLMRRRNPLHSPLCFCLFIPVPHLYWEGGVVQGQTSGTLLCATFKHADLKAGDLRKRDSPNFFSKSLEMRVAEGCQGALLEKKPSSLSGSVQIVGGLVEFHE